MECVYIFSGALVFFLLIIFLKISLSNKETKRVKFDEFCKVLEKEKNLSKEEIQIVKNKLEQIKKEINEFGCIEFNSINISIDPYSQFKIK